MRGHYLDRILASTALALVLGSSMPALAQIGAERLSASKLACRSGRQLPSASNDVTKGIPANASPSGAC